MPRLLLAVSFAVASAVAAASDSAAGSGAVRARLEARVAADPGDAAAQRLLGRVLLDGGDVPAALDRLAAAVELDPFGGAARFDYGRALAASGDPAAAAGQWRRAIELAPDSEYAAGARSALAALPPELEFAPDAAAVEPVDYTIREFPGPPPPGPIGGDDAVPPVVVPAEDRLPITARLQTGLLYNSNVALAPLSRQLAPGNRSSFQLFASPEIEWAAASGTFGSGNGWAAGPLFVGNFTLNEGNFRDFDLQSYTPGLFAEAALPRQAGMLIPRLEYRFTLDQFSGRTFGRRHGVLARLTAAEDDGDATVGYLGVDRTDFAADGVLPSVTSADGTLYSGGAAREVAIDARYLARLRVGADLDRLDSRGTDYAYYGAGLTGEAVVPVVPTVELKLRGGVGYRIYDRYEFDPSRDELIWRTGGELRKYFGPHFSVAAVASYQRFDSKNPLFSADRFLAGVISEFAY